MNKTKKAIELWKNGEHAKALSIFSKFKLGFSKEEKRTLEIAHDMHQGRGKFYIQLGINPIDVCCEAKQIIARHYSL